MNIGAKATGLIVFLAGIIMLVAVFMTALHMLQGHSAPADLKALPQAGLILLGRVLFLFLLGYISSAVAGRGIQLFEATVAREREARTVVKEA